MRVHKLLELQCKHKGQRAEVCRVSIRLSRGDRYFSQGRGCSQQVAHWVKGDKGLNQEDQELNHFHEAGWFSERQGDKTPKESVFRRRAHRNSGLSGLRDCVLNPWQNKNEGLFNHCPLLAGNPPRGLVDKPFSDCEGRQGSPVISRSLRVWEGTPIATQCLLLFLPQATPILEHQYLVHICNTFAAFAPDSSSTKAGKLELCCCAFKMVHLCL